MEYENLLPIGSVVSLHDAKKKLMIFGIGQHDPETDQDYDYVGVFYPEGCLGEGSMYLFNHEDIKEICFKGCDDDERREFINALQNSIAEITDEQ